MRISQSSLEYWKKREDEARKKYASEEQDYDKVIAGIYRRMLADIQLQINGFYAQYASSEGISIAEAKKRASTLDMQVFAEKAKKYVETKDLSPQANAEMKLYNMTMKANRLELLKANIGLEMVSGFDEMNKFFEKILIERVNEEAVRQSGILGQTIELNAKTAKTLIEASYRYASFSDTLWLDQTMLKNDLSTLLERGIIQGKHANVLSKELEKDLAKKFDKSKFYVQRLMRTEMARVQSEAQKLSFEQMGYEQFVFIAEHDRKTCLVCEALDGMVYSIDKMVPGETMPPMHPMCRCSTAAYMSRGEFENMVARSRV